MIEFLKGFYVGLGILFNVILLIVLVYASIYIHRTNKERSENFHVMKSRKNYYDFISSKLTENKCLECKHNKGFTKNCNGCIDIKDNALIYQNFEEA
jgi:hypothetical protein